MAKSWFVERTGTVVDFGKLYKENIWKGTNIQHWEWKRDSGYFWKSGKDVFRKGHMGTFKVTGIIFL